VTTEVVTEGAAATPLEGVRVVVIGELGERARAALGAAGAAVETRSPEELWIHELAADVVLVAGLPLDRGLVVVRELRCADETRRIPRLAVVSAEGAGPMLAVGGVALVDEGASEATVVELVWELAPVPSEEARRRIAAEDEARRLTGELEAQRRERSALIHDVRVLLAVVMGFAANLRDGIVGTLSDEQRDSAERIVSATRDASALLERGGGPPPSDRRGPGAVRRAPRRAQVALDELAASVVQLFQETAERAGVTLALEAPEPLVVWCDAVQIKQVVVNLLVNALKFTPRGGRVSLSVERGAPPSSSRGGFEARSSARLVVADSGPGVRLADRERIFERGVRLERDAGKPGSGIGLSVVKDIAALHQARLAIEESPLGGAAFSIVLPFDLRKRGES